MNIIPTRETENNRMKVLLVDDDRKFCRLVQNYLKPMGFDVKVAHNGIDGLEKATSESFHAVILDIMMPGEDGFGVLQKLRQESNVPVLMLTALGEEADRIMGLEMGADDYVPKTFSTRELLARLRAVIRRHLNTEASKPDIQLSGIMIVGGLKINLKSRTASLDGHDLDLTAFEFDLLTALARSAGCVLTRDQLLDAMAGREYEIYDRSVDVHISTIRKKLGDDPREPRYIKTIRSVGYMLQTQEG
ncbi:response regulator transcription factor [Thermodesulfobacteriota bacterium]